MADPRETPRLESEEIEMSVLQGDFNRQDPGIPPPLPPKQSRKDPYCRPEQTWTDPSCRPKQTQGLQSRHSGQIPEDPTHRSRWRRGRRKWKVPSSHTQETLGLPPRPPEQAPDEPSVTLLLPKQRDGRTAGVYRHRLREEDLVKLPLNPMYGADLDLPSEPDDQQANPNDVVGATQAEMSASGDPADHSTPADGPGHPPNRDARSARPVPSTQRPGITTGGAQPGHTYEDGDTFMGLGQPLNRKAPTLPSTPRPARSTDGDRPVTAATHTYKDGDAFRQGLGPALNRDDGPPPVPSTPRPGRRPGGAQQLPSWPQMLLNPQAILDQLQPNAMYDSSPNQPPAVAQESRTIWGRLRHRLSTRLLIGAAISSVVMVTLMIVVPVLLTHFCRSCNHDSSATTKVEHNTTGSTALMMKTDQVTSADVIKVSPVHGRGPSHVITVARPAPINKPVATGPAPTNKPVSATTTEDKGDKKHVITFGDGSGAEKLRGARGVAVSPDSNIWVAVQSQASLQVYSMAGAFLYKFPQGGPGLGYTSKRPVDVSIDKDGHLWVLMSGYPANRDTLVQLDREGHLKAKFDLPDNIPRGVLRGMAVGLQNDHVFVTWSDGYSGGVQAFQPDGTHLWDGQRGMRRPMYVAANEEGNIFVTDSDTHYIFKFSESGQYVSRFGGPGQSGGGLSHPRGICVDSSGHIMVVDTNNQRVVVFTSRGRYVRHIAVRAEYPKGVAVGPGGQLVVTNINTITVFPHY
ncbi:PREDICTED: uncharacterized protein LOC109486632 [Branchiostoma belcheri]|uniref:Uncharacterized protein LOC109486632 n=1 Tax=Branchiostoma belcheri TaxID=7741 RepID=A0A6P5AIE4_BRABE|nr:PREDICTED: uncharacterized protein LOC109486632 [Branchiostoma belcheri]